MSLRLNDLYLDEQAEIISILANDYKTSSSTIEQIAGKQEIIANLLQKADIGRDEGYGPDDSILVQVTGNSPAEKRRNAKLGMIRLLESMRELYSHNDRAPNFQETIDKKTLDDVFEGEFPAFSLWFYFKKYSNDNENIMVSNIVKRIIYEEAHHLDDSEISNCLEAAYVFFEPTLKSIRLLFTESKGLISTYVISRVTQVLEEFYPDTIREEAARWIKNIAAAGGVGEYNTHHVFIAFITLTGRGKSGLSQEVNRHTERILKNNYYDDKYTFTLLYFTGYIDPSTSNYYADQIREFIEANPVLLHHIPDVPQFVQEVNYLDYLFDSLDEQNIVRFADNLNYLHTYDILYPEYAYEKIISTGIGCRDHDNCKAIGTLLRNFLISLNGEDTDLNQEDISVDSMLLDTFYFEPDLRHRIARYLPSGIVIKLADTYNDPIPIGALRLHSNRNYVERPDIHIRHNAVIMIIEIMDQLDLESLYQKICDNLKIFDHPINIHMSMRLISHIGSQQPSLIEKCIDRMLKSLDNCTEGWLRELILEEIYHMIINTENKSLPTQQYEKLFDSIFSDFIKYKNSQDNTYMVKILLYSYSKLRKENDYKTNRVRIIEDSAIDLLQERYLDGKESTYAIDLGLHSPEHSSL